MKLEIGQKKNRELLYKTLLWNSIREVFRDTFDIDVGEYLLSIIKKDKLFIVHTKKPILNTEAILYKEKIQDLFLSKLEKAWICEKDIEIIFC